MIYTDKVHLVADNLFELHSFAKTVGLKRFYFHGVRKSHPHYDITNNIMLNKVLEQPNVQVVSSKIILIKSKNLLK